MLSLAVALATKSRIEHREYVGGPGFSSRKQNSNRGEPKIKDLEKGESPGMWFNAAKDRKKYGTFKEEDPLETRHRTFTLSSDSDLSHRRSIRFAFLLPL